MLEAISYNDVVKTIEEWTPEQRLSLIRELVRSLESEWRDRPGPRTTFQRALGLAATGQPAPSDEQVSKWLDERRMEKYN